MTAPVLVHHLQQHGVALSLDGDRIIADGPDSVLTDETIDAIRQLKPQIRHLLQSQQANGWDSSDWKAFFDERAGILEYDHGLSRQAAEARAFECTIVDWLNQHPEPSDPDRCARCGAKETCEARVVPCGTSPAGYTWLHPGCWQSWHVERRQAAIAALSAFNIDKPGKERS